MQMPSLSHAHGGLRGGGRRDVHERLDHRRRRHSPVGCARRAGGTRPL